MARMGSTGPRRARWYKVSGHNWSHIPGYDVTTYGRVYSIASNWRGLGLRQLRQDLNCDGYPSVRLLVKGKRTRVVIYKLVASAFLPPRPSPAHEIRHLDGNKLNSHSNNLAWGTRKDNADDRERHGRTSRGTRHSEFIKAGQVAKEARHG